MKLADFVSSDTPDMPDILIESKVADSSSPSLATELPSLTRECIAEALGTAMIVIFGCGSVTAGAASLFGVSFTFGTVVYLMVESLGDVSGGMHSWQTIIMLLYVSAHMPCNYPPQPSRCTAPQVLTSTLL